MIKWTAKRSDLSGSRWAIYEKDYRSMLEWKAFKDDVVIHNPKINLSTGWCFVKGYEYVMPQIHRSNNTPIIEIPDKSKNVIENVPYFSQLSEAVEWTYKYFGSDSDSNDDTPDGCWKTCDRSRGAYGKGAKKCYGPWEKDTDNPNKGNKGCIRPGACNVTSLWMALCKAGLNTVRNNKLIDNAEELQGHDVGWLKSHPLSPSWLYYYIMETAGNGKQRWNGHNPVTACNSKIVANPDNMKKAVDLISKFHGNNIDINIERSDLSFDKYKQWIDEDTPVVMNSAKMGHVICGIGYNIRGSVEFANVHDPYGRKDTELTCWEKYNFCGEDSMFGKNVLYLFSRLKLRYMLRILKL